MVVVVSPDQATILAETSSLHRDVLLSINSKWFQANPVFTNKIQWFPEENIYSKFWAKERILYTYVYVSDIINKGNDSSLLLDIPYISKVGAWMVAGEY